MKIQNYNDAQVVLIRYTENPMSLLDAAMNLTMETVLEENRECSKESLGFLIRADHTSLLEHISFTFALRGISRSLLAQITRHRMSSFTSASQHYADYREMPMVVKAGYEDLCRPALEASVESYIELIDEKGVEIYEARQVLPGAAAVNLLWTINARSLINFFTLRLCKRNVDEMITIASKVYGEVYGVWREFANYCGPYCYLHGKCNQGKMSCGEPWEPSDD